MSADILVYALVAAGLIFWLRSLLGTRHGDERQRSNPYLSSPEMKDSAAGKDMGGAGEAPTNPADIIAELSEKKDGVFSVETSAAESGLLSILKSNKEFDLEFFMNGAQEAFAIIVESFAEGDRETLGDLLHPSVYKAFETAIEEREAREEKQETEIHAVRKVEILDAEIRNKTAFITVRFTADETSVTTDKDGERIAGHPDKVTKMRDVWVFGRPLRSRDPRWLVYETRGDLEDDNDLIPDTDG